jgi:serine/threonine protein kinase
MAKVTIGSIIDHYQILEQIGQGGMGVVYKALNVNLEKFVAIKTIALGLTSEDIFTSRFRTEARALARLENPHIVHIYDMRADDNQWFIVMEYVEGITLAEKIKRDRIIPWPEALAIFQQMLTAIGHAHRLGVIHRDIKPNNIMITGEGIVKITDFGLAKDRYTRSLTQPVSTGGTLYYMSPEQVKGLLFTDHRSDIYSLGLTLYEMLAGKIPFRKGDTDFTIREAIVKRQFPPPSYFNPQLSDSLDALVMKLIAKDPNDRYQDIDEIKQTLAQLLQPAGQSQSLAKPAGSKAVRDNYDSIFSDELAAILPSQFNDRRRSGRLLAGHWSKYRKSLFLVMACLLAFIIGRYNYPKIIPLFSRVSAEKKYISSLNIISEPGGARVFINGKEAGRSPLLLDSIANNYIFISLQKDKYFQIDTLLNLSGLGGTTFTVALPPTIQLAGSVDSVDLHRLTDKQPVSFNESHQQNISIAEQELKITDPASSSSGVLEITSTPAGAEIWLDNIQIQEARTPWILRSCPPGKHQLTIKKPGYADYTAEASVQADLRNVFDAELIIRSGLLSIQVFPWGSIFIDDIIKMENTNIKYRENLPVGQHQLRIVHPLLGKLEKTIQIEADRSEEVLINFNTIINIRVTAFDPQGKPVWAEIIVDDKNTGEMTPKEIGLHIGYHTIAAQKDGYILVNGEKEIMVENSLEEPLKFILRKIM